MSGIGVAIGPMLGGWLLEHFSWGSVFLVNVPVVAVALPAGYFLLPNSRAANSPKLDLLGALLSIVSLVSLVWAIIEAPAKGWTSTEVLVAFAVGAVTMAAFIWWQSTTEHPMLDLEFFKNPRFSAANLAITLTFFAMFGSMFMITQFMQFVLGYTPLEAGIRSVPLALMLMLVAPQSTRLVRRAGTKLVVAGGPRDGGGRLGRRSDGDPGTGLLRPHPPVADPARARHRPGDGAGHRVDHGVAAPRQGRRRLGHERHHPPGGRRPRGGRHRQRVRIAVRTRHHHEARRHPPPQRGDGCSDRLHRRCLLRGPLGRGGNPTTIDTPIGTQIADAARDAFAASMGRGLLVSAAIALVGALVALVFLPAHATPVADAVVADEDDAVEAMSATPMGGAEAAVARQEAMDEAAEAGRPLAPVGIGDASSGE